MVMQRRTRYKCMYCDWEITTHAWYDGKMCPECGGGITPVALLSRDASPRTKQAATHNN